MTDQEESDYRALKAYGHSPAKAAEIVLDAKRGDHHARSWIAAIRPATGIGTLITCDRGA